MDKLLTIDYWFALNPGGWQDLRFYTLGLGIFLIIIPIVVKIITKSKGISGIFAGLINRLTTCLVTVGFLELVLWFFREQKVPFFSARFWQLLLLLIAIIWLGFIVRAYRKRQPLEKEAKERAVVYDNYLPKRK